MEELDQELHVLMMEAITCATPWNVPANDPLRVCGNARDRCKNPANSLCSNCRLDKYCSQECQKTSWPLHKKLCRSHSKVPVHEVVSSDPKDVNYFMADTTNPKSLDRPNIFLDIKNLDAGNETLAYMDRRLQLQYVHHKLRCDFYGIALYPKTVIMVEDRNLATTLLDLIKERTFDRLQEWGKIKHWFRVLHEATPAADRQSLLETWAKIDSPVRVLIVSPLSGLGFIVPDVENIIVFSAEGPRAVEPR
jgi:hypothetical protein